MAGCSPSPLHPNRGSPPLRPLRNTGSGLSCALSTGTIRAIRRLTGDGGDFTSRFHVIKQACVFPWPLPGGWSGLFHALSLPEKIAAERIRCHRRWVGFKTRFPPPNQACVSLGRSAWGGLSWEGSLEEVWAPSLLQANGTVAFPALGNAVALDREALGVP